MLSNREIEAMVREFGELFAGGARPTFISPDFIADISRSRRPEAGTYRGIDAADRLFASMRDAVEELRWRARVVSRPDEDTVVLETALGGRGRFSGIDIEGNGAMVWKLRDGKLAEAILFQTLDDARAHVLRIERARRVAEARLYFVCEARPGGRDPRPLLDAAIRGGAGIVQLRDKDLGDEALVEAAMAFRAAADAGGALFVLNDRPDLVDACNADGVHVGQDDVAVAEARKIAGETALVGLSTHTFAQVEEAGAAAGLARPDQISVGPVWATPTKPGRPATGLGLIEFAAARATIPWFAIGGIDPGNIAAVVAAGARRAVIVRAIRDAADPGSAAAELATALEAGNRQNAGADG